MTTDLDKAYYAALVEDARREVEEKLHVLLNSYARLEHYKRKLEEVSNEKTRTNSGPTLDGV